jgi:predicted nucleotidyltransferase
MDKKSNILSIIKKTVRFIIPGAEVRLFGSRARSDSDSDSDYDILVITEKTLTPEEKLPLKTAVRKELLKYGIRSDVLIQSSEEIEIKKKLPGHIIRNILKEAIIL